MLEKEFLLIKIVKRFEGFYKKMGVNFEQFLWILRLKLTLDSRKMSIQESVGNKSKMDGTKQNLLVMGVVGIFLGMMMPLPLDLYYKVAVLGGMNLFFLVMYMISDFSSVLLDVRDTSVIMTKPVDSKTMNAARITHIAYYMISMFGALNALSFVLGTAKHGPMFALSMLLMMFFLSFLIIFFTTILYSLLLKFFSGEKLKDVLNLLQIVLTVVTIIGYQLLARMFDFVDLEITVNISWWSYLLPSTWFAGLFKILVEGNITQSYIIMAVLSIVVPIVLGSVLISMILPKYERYLTKLSVEGILVEKRRGPFTFVKDKLMKAFASDHTELAFMKFTDSNLSRDRKLKLTLYPNHVMGLIFPFLMLMNNLRGGTDIFEALASLHGSIQYLMLYIAGVFLMTNFDLLKYSSSASGAFIFDSFPIENKAIFYRAALKTYYIKFILPSMIVMSAIFILLFGVQTSGGILLINATMVLAMYLKGYVMGMFQPFSTEFGTTGNKNIGAVFAMMAVVGGFAGIHYVTIQINPVLVWGLFAIVSILCKVLASGILKKKVVI